VDPTTLDLNGDGIRDFGLRGGAPFPVAELSGGTWRASEGKALDTQPKNPFSERTIVDVRFRSTGVTTHELYGAVFWINVDQAGAMFSALNASLTRRADGNGQDLSIRGKRDVTVTVDLFTVPGLPDAMVDLRLDIDVRANQVSIWVNGTFRGAFSYPETAPPQGDEWATLIAWSGSGGGEFDHLKVVLCQP
jgi:hypothetical protein